MPIRISGSTGISGLDGSATTPAIQGASANSGIYYSGNTVFVSTSGTNALTIGPTGNVAFANSSVSIGGQNVAPSYGMKNRIINGNMRIDQRNAGASVTTSALQTITHTLDRWAYYNDVVSKRTIQQSSTAPAGFTSSLLVTVAATDTVGPQQFIRQAVEGINIYDLAWGTASAKTVTLSFWVRSSVTGQHGGSIQNNGTTRSFPFAYTINSADTWEYKTITVPGDTTGTWLTTNGIGLILLFENGVGYQKATAGTWVGQNTTSSTGSVNLCATNGATWYITGVQFEVGSVATPFEFRHYTNELQLCQRYYELINGDGGNNYFLHPIDLSSGYRRGMINYKVTKRANASVTFTTTGSPTAPQGVQLNTISTVGLYYNGAASGTYVCVDTVLASAEL